MNNNANNIIKGLEGSLKDDSLSILEEQINEAIKVLKYLAGRDAVLSKLEAAGVDNWEGYDDAINGEF